MVYPDKGGNLFWIAALLVALHHQCFSYLRIQQSFGFHHDRFKSPNQSTACRESNDGSSPQVEIFALLYPFINSGVEARSDLSSIGLCSQITLCESLRLASFPCVLAVEVRLYYGYGNCSHSTQLNGDFTSICNERILRGILW